MPFEGFHFVACCGFHELHQVLSSPLLLDALLVQHEVHHEGGAVGRPPRLVSLQGPHKGRVRVVQDHVVRLKIVEDIEALSRLQTSRRT